MTLLIRSRGPQALQDRYEASIDFVLQQISRSHAGREVLARLRASARRIRIVPFGRRDVAAFNEADLSPFNAHAAPGYWPGAGTIGRGDPGRGTGTEVHFSPGWVQRGNPRATDDVVLLHELSHALRAATGSARFRRTAAGALRNVAVPRFANIEEFFCQMVEGTHASELGLPVRADNWQVGQPTPAYLSQAPYPDLFADFERRVPGIVGDLAPADAPFNPWRDVAAVP